MAVRACRSGLGPSWRTLPSSKAEEVRARGVRDRATRTSRRATVPAGNCGTGRRTARRGLDLLRDVLQPWLGVVAAVAVAAPALVVQVLAVGVPLGDAVDSLALLDVPAHEVQGVGEVVAAGAPAAGLALVVGPGLVLGLGVAVGGADPAPGMKPRK